MNTLRWRSQGKAIVVCTNPHFNVETEEHVETTTATPAVKFDDKLMDEIQSQIHEEAVVIVNCSYSTAFTGGISIWNPTFLIDKASVDRSAIRVGD